MRRAFLRGVWSLAAMAMAVVSGCMASPGDGVSTARDDLRVQAGTCGDGIRQSGEECDLGASAAATTFCTAQCGVRDVLAIPATTGDAGVVRLGRTLGAAHAVAASDHDEGVAFVETNGAANAVKVLVDGITGVAKHAPWVLDSAALGDANPALSAVGTNGYLAVWTDYAADGDGRGIAFSTISTLSGIPAKTAHANTTTVGDQRDPDVVVAGANIVVAFTDMSNPATAPDVRYRVFDTSMRPLASDQALGATSDSEGDVSLAPFAGSWAAAWRVGTPAGELVRVQTHGATWSLGPFAAGPAGDRPALVALDATHLLVVFSQQDGLHAAVLNISQTGTVTPVALRPSPLQQSSPALAQAGGQTFVAWHEDATPEDPNGEELWLMTVGWNGTALDLTAAPIPVPRTAADQHGDQRSATLAAGPGPALFAAWVDDGDTFGGGEAQGDLALELAPVPIVRPTCTCSGTGYNGPVTLSCDQTVCGTDSNTYQCTASGWQYYSGGCVWPVDGGACHCTGTGYSGPLDVPCGQTGCGTDHNTYACSSAGWSYSGPGCSGSCTCSGTGISGQVIVACGATTCGTDGNTYVCNAPGGPNGWAYSAAGCSR